MFSSPGMPKIYSTPSFSRHVTSSLAAVDSKCAVMVSPSREGIKGHLTIAIPRVGWCSHNLPPLALQPAGNIDVAFHQPACGTSGGGLFHVPALSLFVDACRQVHHCRWVAEPEHPAGSCLLRDHLMHQRAWDLCGNGGTDGTR